MGSNPTATALVVVRNRSWLGRFWTASHTLDAAPPGTPWALRKVSHPMCHKPMALRGVRLTDLEPTRGSEANKSRPGIIVSTIDVP